MSGSKILTLFMMVWYALSFYAFVVVDQFERATDKMGVFAAWVLIFVLLDIIEKMEKENAELRKP